jgi:predicted metal-binding membrane protein
MVPHAETSAHSAAAGRSDVASQRAFLAGSAVLFAAGTAVTILWCGSMSQMGEMPMPGDWTMSMVWMRMPGQGWPEAAASFLGMWAVMMMTMMLPSLVPMLWRYRAAVGRTDRLGPLTALVGLAYFLVWSVAGVVVFPVGLLLATLEMRHLALARTVPTAMGVAVVLLGALQFTAWKARLLACCRQAPACRALRSDVHTAWQHGLRLGLKCAGCCANLMAIPLIIGIMDLRAMFLATAAITVERLAPAGERVARGVGLVMVAVGLVLIARAASAA